MFARVVIDSPLAQLDHPFDYTIPDELADSVLVGTRVKVTLGRSKQLLDAFVVDIVEGSDFSSSAVPLTELVSAAPVLRPNIYRFAQAVSKRQASTVAEVLKHAIPNRSVSVEKLWLDNAPVIAPRTVAKPRLSTAICSIGSAENTWIKNLLNMANEKLATGYSVMAIVPDVRDLNLLRAAIPNTVRFVEYQSDLKPSVRYRNFLSCITNDPMLVIGTRSAIYAPLENLGLIFVLDEADSGHREQSSPYVQTRELALIRQQVESCSLHFESNSRSPEIQRLLNLKYLKDETKALRVPKITVLESESRIDSTAWATVRESVRKGPVLIQVARRGESSALFCATCSARASCSQCNGPLWTRVPETPECRWCSAINLHTKCAKCGGSKFRKGLAGSSRTLAQFGRLFPQIPLVEATAERRIERISSRPQIVVATPGAEPEAEGGYQAVIILDAAVHLSKDNLRSEEDAVRLWSKTIGKLSEDGSAVLVGNIGQLGRYLSHWEQAELAQAILRERTELRFPPATRICTLTGTSEAITAAERELRSLDDVECLGPVSVWTRSAVTEQRLIIRFSYARGPIVSDILKAVLLKVSAGSRQNSRGRNLRPLRIIMDDPEVL